MLGRSGAPALGAALLRFVPALLSALATAFGMVVLVFAILERLMLAAAFELDDETWDPAKLASRPNPDQVKPAELIVTVVFVPIGLIILNLYLGAIGFGYIADGKWVLISVLFSLAIIGGLVVTIVVTSLEIGVGVYRLWTRPALSAAPARK